MFVALCGVGMVGAASCTQVLLDRYSVAAVINTGVAGSLDAHIDIGDLVIAADAVNHVMDVQNLGYAPGQNPDFDLVAFPTDNTLRTSAFEIAREMGLTAHEGRIASGDRFVRENTDKQRIVDTFKARCCEMEGAAIAQVCWRAQVPCALVRAISDKADGSASVDYPAFEAQAGRRCAALVAHLVQRIRL